MYIEAICCEFYLNWYSFPGGWYTHAFAHIDTCMWTYMHANTQCMHLGSTSMVFGNQRKKNPWMGVMLVLAEPCHGSLRWVERLMGCLWPLWRWCSGALPLKAGFLSSTPPLALSTAAAGYRQSLVMGYPVEVYSLAGYALEKMPLGGFSLSLSSSYCSLT